MMRQRRGAGGGGHRVGIERPLMGHLLLPALRHHAEVQQRQDVPAPGHRRARQPAGDDLGERRQVRPHTERRLCAARRDPEAGDHLVQDQQHIVFLRQLTQCAHEVRADRHLAEGRAGRLQNHRGDVAVARQRGAHRIQVVRRHQHGFFRHARQHAWGRRAVVVVGVAAGHMVVPAMEVALEAQDRLPSGEGARQAHRHQRRLGAGGRETHAFRRGHQPLYGTRPGDLPRMVGAELGALGEGLLDRRADDRVIVTEQQSAVPAEVVDVAVAVHVPFMRPLGAGDVDAIGIELAGIVGDTAGKQRRGLPRQRRGPRRMGAIGGSDTGVAAGLLGKTIHRDAA